MRVSVFDGARQPFSADARLLVTLIDGAQKQLHRKHHDRSSIPFRVPFHNNFADDYTVIVHADDHVQAGFTPVRVSAHVERQVELMLLAEDSRYVFRDAGWTRLEDAHPELFRVLSGGAAGPAARERYEQLQEGKPESLAAIFNVLTALAEIHLPQGSPLDYVQQLIWDQAKRPMRADRFFGFADKSLAEQLEQAADQGVFARQPGSSAFHPGATRSFKQVQFGEANVQLTLHEKEKKTIGGTPCVVVEADIDYHKDLLAHALLEVLPHHLTGGISDPKTVYVLRWMAGRHAGVPEFSPPYTIEAA